MKQFGFVFFTLLMGISSLQAKHVPKKVMHHYCTEVAAATYNVPLQRIDAQPPVYKKKGFVVHGTIDHRNGALEKFSCRYDAYGRFQFIKKHIPKHTNTNTVQKRIRHACKTEASVRWHIPPHEVKIRNIRKISTHRFEVTLDEAERTGKCIVNRQGYVSRFQTLEKRRHAPRAAQHACIKKAASRWNIPTAYVEIDSAEYLGRGRYLLELSDDGYGASCEVKNNGIVYRFTEHHIPNQWR